MGGQWPEVASCNHREGFTSPSVGGPNSRPMQRCITTTPFHLRDTVPRAAAQTNTRMGYGKTQRQYVYTLQPRAAHTRPDTGRVKEPPRVTNIDIVTRIVSNVNYTNRLRAFRVQDVQGKAGLIRCRSNACKACKTRRSACYANLVSTPPKIPGSGCSAFRYRRQGPNTTFRPQNL